MIICAHQPCFLPWLGYLHKVASSDLFVILDHVQYERANYQNRNRFKLPEGVRWLTVPVEHGSQQDRILDKRLAEDPKWSASLWRALERGYRRAPHFERYAGALRATLERPWTKLVELDLCLLELCFDWLGIHTPRVRSSTLGLTQRKSALIEELCVRVGADVYLAGQGGSRTYLDAESFARRGVRVAFQQFIHPTYPQLHMQHGFVSHLSALDALFNCGPAARDLVRPGPTAEAASA